MTMCNIIGPVLLSALSEGTNAHTGCGVGRVTDRQQGVCGTHTAFPAERRLVSKSPLPEVIMFVAKMQCCCRHKVAYFKWHCCTSNNRVWFHTLFKERNKFGEYHHALRALWGRPTMYL